MSQPHGRYSRSQDKSPRQSRQPSKTTSQRQHKPYIKTPPARDPAQTASIFKTRSFKWLVDAVGAENIALALDSNLARVAELINGEKFTPETAFHIETTLGLPNGFFDQPNPALTSETITRLRAPLNPLPVKALQESADGQALEPSPAILADHHSTATDLLPRESEMPKRTHRTDGDSQHALSKRNPTNARTATTPPSKTASTKIKESLRSGSQQSLPLTDVAALQNIRRANLHVLTSRKGSKVRLSTVVNISASNLDNRLYGQKRMDDAEANRFTEPLGLPTGWLDVPRSVSDIPESVSALLDPLAARSASGQQEFPAAKMPEAARARKSARKDTKAASDRLAQRSEPEHPSGAVIMKALMEQQDPELSQASDLATRKTVDSDFRPSASQQPAAPASITEVIAEPRRSGPVTSLGDLIGIEPIAEALIKTLAGKARTGRLDEMKALELLRQIVSL